jgi:hypothetical protein
MDLRLRRLVAWLLAATAAQAALTLGHFEHGACVYDDPGRTHVVAPILAAVAVVAVLAGLFARRPGPLTLWPLVVTIAVPFVAVFGAYHGGFSHVLKLASWAAGSTPAQLLETFDSPDFAVPNDVVFEVSGVATLVAGGAIAALLARLLRVTRHGRDLRRAAAAAPAPSAARGS